MAGPWAVDGAMTGKIGACTYVETLQ